MTDRVITVDGQRARPARTTPSEPIKLVIGPDLLPVAEVVELPARTWDAWAPTEPADLETPK